MKQRAKSREFIWSLAEFTSNHQSTKATLGLLQWSSSLYSFVYFLSAIWRKWIHSLINPWLQKWKANKHTSFTSQDLLFNLLTFFHCAYAKPLNPLVHSLHHWPCGKLLPFLRLKSTDFTSSSIFCCLIREDCSGSTNFWNHFFGSYR